MINAYLKENPVKNRTDVNALMREMISFFSVDNLDGGMDDRMRKRSARIPSGLLEYVVIYENK